MAQHAGLELHEAEQRLRDKVLQRIGNLHNLAIGQLGLKRAFLMFDPADTGIITPESFIKILANFGFSRKDAAMIFRAYDTTHSGSIDIRAFQRLLMRPGPPAYSTLAVAEAKQKAKMDVTLQMRSMSSTSKPRNALPLEEVQRRLKAKLEHRVGNLFNRSSGLLGQSRAFGIFNPVNGSISWNPSPRP